MSNLGIGLHWLEFSVPHISITRTMDELDEYYDNEWQSGRTSFSGYQFALYGRDGGIVLFDKRRPEHHIILPGRWLTAVGEQSAALLGWIFNHGCKLSRIDIAMDDYNCSPMPDDIRHYYFEGSIVTRAVRKNFIESHGGDKSGVTVYIGSMKSERFIRIYDKTAETKGEIHATRWEILLRNDYAQTFLLHVLSSSLNTAFKGLLLNMIDFREPTKQKRESRRPRMDWYDHIIGNIEKAIYTKYEPIRTLEQKEHWLQKQVSRTLAEVIQEKDGDLDFIDDLISRGKEKLKK